MTPEEAKTKWCPLARLYHYADDDPNVPVAAYNRAIIGYGSDEAYCIGTDCMAWRWKYRHPPDANLSAHDEGYCGAFGKDGVP